VTAAERYFRAPSLLRGPETSLIARRAADQNDASSVSRSSRASTPEAFPSWQGFHNALQSFCPCDQEAMQKRIWDRF